MIPTLCTYVGEQTLQGTTPIEAVVGPSQKWTAPPLIYADDEVGTYGIDYAIETILTSAGEITKATSALIVESGGKAVERLRVRGSRTWTRAFLPVDSGESAVGVASNNQFRASDKIYVRSIIAHRYKPSPYIYAIDQLKPPKPLSGLQAFDSLDGSLRMQRTGNLGCEIEMTLCFLTGDDFVNFMKSRHDGYMVFKSRYGVYGGYLDGSQSEPERKGASVFLRVKFLSPQRAGVGVDGL